MDDNIWDVYDSMATSYASHAADSAYNAHYDRPALLALCGDVESLHVLDAGCGPGLYAAALLEKGANVVAFDASEVMVDLARRRLQGKVEVHHARLGAPLPFASDTFDLVLCALVIHYVDDRTQALTELYRILRPGAAVVLSTQHPTADWLRKGGSYFDVTVETDVWRLPEGEWEVPFWREPMTTFCEAIHRAGFLIERLVEPPPAESMRERWPDDFEKLCTEPAFLNFRLIKGSSDPEAPGS